MTHATEVAQHARFEFGKNWQSFLDVLDERRIELATQALRTMLQVERLDGKTFLAEVGGSTHYHANYVRPRWAKRLKKMDTIGTHIFYKLRPGQT